MRVVIYARVSRKDQAYDRQVSELQQYALEHGHEVIEVITEKLSGSTTTLEKRDGIAKLFEQVESGKVEKVLVSEVSRMGRRTQDVLQIMERLHQNKVSLYVYNYRLETLDGKGKVNSMAQFLITLLGDIARMETATLAERINSGLDEARRKGKKLGRPSGTNKEKQALIDEYKHVVKHLNQGQSQRHTALITGVSLSTVQRVAKALKPPPPSVP